MHSFFGKNEGPNSYTPFLDDAKDFAAEVKSLWERWNKSLEDARANVKQFEEESAKSLLENKKTEANAMAKKAREKAVENIQKYKASREMSVVQISHQ